MIQKQSTNLKPSVAENNIAKNNRGNIKQNRNPKINIKNEQGNMLELIKPKVGRKKINQSEKKNHIKWFDTRLIPIVEIENNLGNIEKVQAMYKDDISEFTSKQNIVNCKNPILFHFPVVRKVLEYTAYLAFCPITHSELMEIAKKSRVKFKTAIKYTKILYEEMTDLLHQIDLRDDISITTIMKTIKNESNIKSHLISSIKKRNSTK